MKIGIEINGVLRDTLKKIQQEYEKWYLNENWKEMKFVEDEKDIEAIEVFALAYMRGMNIDNSILIFEEAQNSTPSQMKLLLTRIGFNSKFFISGDLEQFDRHKDKTQTGLWDAMKKFRDLPSVGVHEFGDGDIVRNPLITQILKRYEE